VKVSGDVFGLEDIIDTTKGRTLRKHKAKTLYHVRLLSISIEDYNKFLNLKKKRRISVFAQPDCKIR